MAGALQGLPQGMRQQTLYALFVSTTNARRVLTKNKILTKMKKMELKQMESIVAGRNDADCGWAAAQFVANVFVGTVTGGWGLLYLPFTGRNLLKACELI